VDEQHIDDELSPSLKAEFDRIMFQDRDTQESMAFMLIGMKLVHYGASRLMRELEKTVESGEGRRLLVERAVSEMRKMSMVGFHSEVLLDNLKQLSAILNRDLKEEKKRVKAEKADQFEQGVETPFAQINTKLGGGLRSGDVLLIHGASDAVYPCTAHCYSFFNKRKVPITYYGTKEEKDMPDVPGVVNVPGLFWKNRGTNLVTMRETFASADGYVILLDSLDWLADTAKHGDEAKARQVALKNLIKVAKRYRVAVVVAHSTNSTILPKGEGVMHVHACRRTVDGKPVLMVGDEMYMEDKNGELCIFGDHDGAASAVEGSDAPSEDSE
jgi:hypothetical protein